MGRGDCAGHTAADSSIQRLHTHCEYPICVVLLLCLEEHVIHWDCIWNSVQISGNNPDTSCYGLSTSSRKSPRNRGPSLILCGLLHPLRLSDALLLHILVLFREGIQKLQVRHKESAFTRR